MNLLLEGKAYCTIEVLGAFGQEGGTVMIEQETIHKVRCFVCGNKVDLDKIVVMSFNEDDMVCVCKDHVKYRYPEGTFDYQQVSETASAGSA